MSHILDLPLAFILDKQNMCSFCSIHQTLLAVEAFMTV